MAAVIVQGHTEAPKRREAPHHKPSAHRPSQPERPRHKPATRAQRDPHGRRQRKETHRDPGRKPAHKSAPVDERTLPIGSGARIGIPSLGALPTIIRRH